METHGTDLFVKNNLDNIISISTLINQIFTYFTDSTCKNQSVIRMNNENLCTNGDLSILTNLKLWKAVLKDKLNCNENCTNILQHYTHMHNVEPEEKTTWNDNGKVFQLLILASNNWVSKITKCMIKNERICLFLNRQQVIKRTLESVIKCGADFGKNTHINKTIHLIFQPDEKSELTTTRLRLIKNFTKNILILQGYKVAHEVCPDTIILSSKSQGKKEEHCKRYTCNIVKNSQTNIKETSMTWKRYIEHKICDIERLNKQKFLDIGKQGLNQVSVLQNLVEASVVFELLTVKPSHSVLINADADTDRNLTNTKGAPFILYNYARIVAILQKYETKKSKQEYPELPDIEDIDFSLLTEEDEWELVYNFIFGYPQIIESCVKCEHNFQTYPQVMCLFLSKLCRKFSIYYRRIRILTEGYKHLHARMIARIYMLKALQIIMQNAFLTLDIKPLSKM